MSPRGRTVSRRRRNALIGGGGLIKTIAASEAIYSIGGQDDLIPPVTPTGNVGPQLLVDGDMEAVGTAAYTAGGGGILSKETGTRTGGSGSQVLRITKDAAAQDWAYQAAILEIGKRYRATGWVRSDSTIQPAIGDNTAYWWTGTTSTSWQYFDVTVVAGGTNLLLYAVTGGAAADYVEFDDITVYEQGS